MSTSQGSQNDKSSSVPPPPALSNDAVELVQTFDIESSQTEVIPLSLFDTLPTNVDTIEALTKLPKSFQSTDIKKPLQHMDEDTGEVFTYSLQPLLYSVSFILMVELLERFSYYGVMYTQTLFLTGVYDEDWNADMTAVQASSYVSLGIAIAYTAPFIGAILADSVLGDYTSILVGSLVFYIPGLLLIALTTLPYLLGDTFNTTALKLGLLFLWPIGTGIVKSTVNIFGAKQFHPILQSSLIESYYVLFYMCINVGSLCGGLIVPIMAQHNLTVAYMIPVAMLAFGVVVFLAGTSRYCISKPRGDFVTIICPKKKQVDFDTSSPLTLWTVLKVCCLVIPFSVVYSQNATMFIVQGTVMKTAFGFLDAAGMNNADACAVLLFGYFIGQRLYPWLATMDLKIATTHKFSLGCVLGVLALLWALFVEHLIHSTYEQTGQAISILWQTPSFMLVGCGEIFAISTAYETAFTIGPPNSKALASAINIFCVGGIPNVLCLILYQVCSAWFEDADGSSNIHTLERYTEAHISYYFLVLIGIAVLGIAINVLPPIKDFVESLEEAASDAIKTPRATPRPTRHKTDAASEKSPLLTLEQARKREPHRYVLERPGSMLAAPSFRGKDDVAKKQAAKNRKGFLNRLKRKQQKAQLLKPRASSSNLEAAGAPRKDQSF